MAIAETRNREEVSGRGGAVSVFSLSPSLPLSPSPALPLSHSCDSQSPVSGWRQLATDLATVGASTIFCQALAVVSSLVMRAALSPAQMGVWQALKLLLGYANYANLGVSKGAARELTIALGRGQSDRAQRGLNLAFTVNTLTSVVYGTGLAGAALWLARFDDFGSNGWSIGLLVVALLVVVQRHLTFHVTILRCKQAFALTSTVSVVEGMLTLIVAGAAAWRWGLPGLYGGTILTLLAMLAFLRWRGVRPFEFDWQWTEIKRLVTIGGPILLGGVAATLLQSVDKLAILGFSPNREFDLGCYSITLLITGQIYGLANMFALVVLPRYGELFGRSGSQHQVASLALQASELLAAVTSLSAAIGLVAAVPLLAQCFPDYRPGLPAALWLVPGIVMVALALPLSQFLVAVCRERAAMWATLAAVVVGSAGDFLALSLGYGIRGVGASTAFAWFACYMILLRISIWPLADKGARRRYVMAHMILLTPIVLAVVLTDTQAAALNVPLLVARSLAVVIVWSGAALIVWRLGGWDKVWNNHADRVDSASSMRFVRLTQCIESRPHPPCADGEQDGWLEHSCK